MIPYKRKTAFDINPFTVLGGEGVVEEHLRLDIPASGAEREHIELLAEASIRYVQQLTRRVIVSSAETIWTLSPPENLELPFPILAIASATYVNSSGVITSLVTTDFYVNTSISPSYLTTKSTFSAPSDVSEYEPYPYSFVFLSTADDEALAGGPTQIPRAFIAACLLYLSHLYENRQAVTIGGKPHALPLAFDSLVKSLTRY